MSLHPLTEKIDSNVTGGNWATDVKKAVDQTIRDWLMDKISKPEYVIAKDILMREFGLTKKEWCCDRLEAFSCGEECVFDWPYCQYCGKKKPE